MIKGPKMNDYGKPEKYNSEEWARRVFGTSPNTCYQSLKNEWGVYWDKMQEKWFCASCNLPLAYQ